MKVRQFKTKTNDGYTVHFDVCYVESRQDGYEDYVVIETTRIVPISEERGYAMLNVEFPLFFPIRKTKRYVVLVSRTAPMKQSTFELIVGAFNELKQSK